jgi:hypothetical protein
VQNGFGRGKMVSMLRLMLVLTKIGPGYKKDVWAGPLDLVTIGIVSAFWKALNMRGLASSS